MSAEPTTPTRRLTDDLRRIFRTVLAGLAAVAIVLGALTALLLGVFEPNLRADTDLVRTLRLHHQAMLDRDGALRTFVTTGDRSALEFSRTSADEEVWASQRLMDLMGRRTDVDRAVVAMELASLSWGDGWADRIDEFDAGTIDVDDLTPFLRDGRDRFDRYREAQQTVSDLAALRRDESLTRIRQAIGLGLASVVVVVIAAAWYVDRQRRRLESRIASPIASLVAGMEAIKRNVEPELDGLEGPEELLLLAQHLRDTSRQVQTQRRELEERHSETESAAVTLRGILEVSREISGSLNVRYVAETVAGAASRMAGCERAVVWLTTDGCTFTAVHDTTLPRGAVPDVDPVEIGEAGVGIAARDARPQLHEHASQFPLIVGGRVMGVLEVVGAHPDRIAQASLEMLTTHAAAALEAARLHHTTEELAQLDPLTRLANRRRLDDDLATELERANRYGRPLGFLMVDLDHFKVLNDTYGHPHGDEVLRLTAQCLAGAVRSSDTVYRYGGEEFAVLVREGTREDTERTAKRLRAELARSVAGCPESFQVTASFGVAAAPEHGRTAAELVLSADGALYTAKAEGRDRITVAPLHGQDPIAAVHARR